MASRTRRFDLGLPSGALPVFRQTMLHGPQSTGMVTRAGSYRQLTEKMPRSGSGETGIGTVTDVGLERCVAFSSV